MTAPLIDPDRIEADYLIETAFDPMQAAEIMAGEQSSGTFISVPGETPELKERSAARVERLTVYDSVAQPTLPGAGRPNAGDGLWQRAKVTLSWPIENLGASMPNLIATIAGNLFELKPFSGLRLVDLRLPRAFAQKYAGPQFGMEGTRRLAGVHGRPLIGTIIKPSVGLTVEDTAAMVDQLCAGGIDFIKDDELQADGPACPFDARVKAVMAVVNRHADRTGKKPMVAFNLTGDMDDMRRHHDLVLAEGGTCIMASLTAVGMAGMIELRRHSQLPIHAHRCGWGALTREPMLGWSYPAWSKLWRLAGADHMHVNGLENKFSEADDSVIASARSLSEPLFEEAPMRAVPVFSSGQTVRQAAGTLQAVGSPDLIVTAGGGVVAHPDGIAAGVTAMCEAWDAAAAGVDLPTYAQDHPALAAALSVY
ncbi:Ribulose bisphosphate carboxylase-like protein 2 [Pelagimonas phthalicica]|uniref:Ribulose bisphosphate carboxylase-like protein 2 n=1 Tax=Pelagimonas phthalicica TaxID=1037362 RepID=A0A238JCP2_9RHOB|nr:ribulose-bisphosphate carboxylase large subunit family protein [Pelagimonas phthalicica]TDS93562.1 ribulose-bisphosphate carboxylase large chain [Pelagimonas phthalicica]SMX27917.1 Ribulose bisphosphate carboxylase-like protein 2 [Pelagimonas phthalicica]